MPLCRHEYDERFCPYCRGNLSPTTQRPPENVTAARGATLCAECQYQLSDDLVAAGLIIHPMCEKKPKEAEPHILVLEPPQRPPVRPAHCPQHPLRWCDCPMPEGWTPPTRATAAPRPPIARNTAPIGLDAPATSHKSAARALPAMGTKRRITYDLIRDHGGLCDHEIEALTGWLHQSASAARNSLMNDGWLTDSGKRRNTPQGNPAIVWAAND